MGRPQKEWAGSPFVSRHGMGGRRECRAWERNCSQRDGKPACGLHPFPASGGSCVNILGGGPHSSPRVGWVVAPVGVLHVGPRSSWSRPCPALPHPCLNSPFPHQGAQQGSQVAPPPGQQGPDRLRLSQAAAADQVLLGSREGDTEPPHSGARLLWLPEAGGSKAKPPPLRLQLAFGRRQDDGVRA